MNKILFLLILLLVAFFMLHSGSNKINTHKELYFNGVATEGSVVSVRTKYRRNQNDLHFLTVSYGVNNHEFIIKSQNGVSWPWVPSKGDVVKVVYAANEPEKSEEFSMWNFYFLPALQLFFGFICIVWVALLAFRKNK